MSSPAEWVVGLCAAYYAPATIIVGPFPTRRDACREARERNLADGLKAGLGKAWYWAPAGEMALAIG